LKLEIKHEFRKVASCFADLHYTKCLIILILISVHFLDIGWISHTYLNFLLYKVWKRTTDHVVFESQTETHMFHKKTNIVNWLCFFKKVHRQ